MVLAAAVARRVVRRVDIGKQEKAGVTREMVWLSVYICICWEKYAFLLKLFVTFVGLQWSASLGMVF